MKKFFSLLNLGSVIGIIYWNFLVATGFINSRDMAELSNKIDSLFTPASYAFSIWSIIYILLFANAIWMVLKAFKKQEGETVMKVSIWLIIANLASGFWLYFWQTEQYFISVVCMLAIFFALMILIVKLDMEKWDAPASIIGFVWWPISFYSGWITVATVTNITAYLKVIEFQWLFSEATWTILLIIVVTAVYLYMIASRSMREFAIVGVWAFIAIAFRHWDNIPSIAYTAAAGALILTIAILAHGFKYRKQNPFFKMISK
ncbi:MAG: hypothetical protein ACJAT1_000590 [Marivirga sp.]|jgi:hypothetical protein